MVIALGLAALLIGQAPPPALPPAADLLNAAKVGDLARAREQIAKKAPVDAADVRGYTPLMWAAAAGHLEMTRYLLENRASVDVQSNDGTSALMLASANGNAEIVRLLLARGANPGAGRQGVTPRQLAVARGHTEIAAALEAAEALGAQLLQAAGDGQGMTIRQLLAKGAPLNATNADGVSALMLAARNGDLGTMQFLLSRGADGTVRDRRGQGVFDWADRAPSTRQQVAAFLRERGLRPDAGLVSPKRAIPSIPASLESLDALISKAAAGSAQTRVAQRRAAAAVSSLRELASAWPAESPEDYRANLAANVTALASALAGADAERLRQSLEAIGDDLEAKLEHCRKSGGKLGGSVLVRVRTVQGSAEAPKWQVLYIPRILEVSPSAVPDLFPQLSSPTEELLVPGRYIMWVRNPATARVGERTVVKVGDGRKELLVDLPVPAEPK